MRSKHNYINQEDFARILAAIPSLNIRKWMDGDVIMLFKILYWCALRPEEGIRLKKEDFHLADKEIYLGKTKTEGIGYAPIPDPFIPELELYLNTKDVGFLLPELTYDTLYSWIIKLGNRLKIEAWTTKQSQSHEKTKGHIFRKSVGKDMLYGVHGPNLKDVAIISKQLRHKKPSMTFDKYLNANIEAVKEAWAKSEE